MTCKIYPTGSLKSYKYVVVLSEYQGKILLSRHKCRKTWETQGGHIEAGEQPLDAAKRELFEETRDLVFDIQPLCDYWLERKERMTGPTAWCSVPSFIAWVRFRRVRWPRSGSSMPFPLPSPTRKSPRYCSIISSPVQVQMFRARPQP